MSGGNNERNKQWNPGVFLFSLIHSFPAHRCCWTPGIPNAGGMSLASGVLPAPREAQENPPFQRGPDQLSAEGRKASEKKCLLSCAHHLV